MLKIRPEGALVRYQFIEFLLRIAAFKFYGDPGTETYAYSLIKLLQEHIIHSYRYEQSEKFRQEYLWTASNALIFKANEQNLN